MRTERFQVLGITTLHIDNYRGDKNPLIIENKPLHEIFFESLCVDDNPPSIIPGYSAIHVILTNKTNAIIDEVKRYEVGDNSLVTMEFKFHEYTEFTDDIYELAPAVRRIFVHNGFMEVLISGSKDACFEYARTHLSHFIHGSKLYHQIDVKARNYHLPINGEHKAFTYYFVVYATDTMPYSKAAYEDFLKLINDYIKTN